MPNPVHDIVQNRPGPAPKQPWVTPQITQLPNLAALTLGSESSPRQHSARPPTGGPYPPHAQVADQGIR